ARTTTSRAPASRSTWSKASTGRSTGSSVTSTATRTRCRPTRPRHAERPRATTDEELDLPGGHDVTKITFPRMVFVFSCLHGGDGAVAGGAVAGAAVGAAIEAAGGSGEAGHRHLPRRRRRRSVPLARALGRSRRARVDRRAERLHARLSRCAGVHAPGPRQGPGARR